MVSKSPGVRDTPRLAGRWRARNALDGHARSLRRCWPYAPGSMDEDRPLPIIAHIDMDAFYVAVELRRRPELRGRPVVVAGSGPRAVVTTASYEARRFGVGSAMPAARARRLCPGAVFVAPDFAHYREVSRRVMAILRRHVARVEVVGFDEAYLELTGLPAPHATMRRVRAEIERSEGLSASIGIGPSKLVAKVASDAEKPGGFVVLTREGARERFASAPPGLVPGIGPKTAARLAALGIKTLGQLAAVPEHQLAAGFGPRLGAELSRRARFEDASPLCEQRKVISESRERTFDHDIADPCELERILAGLVERLCSALQKSGRAGRTVGIKVRLDDFSTHTRARTLPEPVAAAERVGPVALELLRRFAAPRPVRLLGVRVAGLEREPGEGEGQLTLLCSETRQ
jgi:DNA polymerase-4